MHSIFTIHIDVFYKLHFFREAIKAIQDQTYQNLEIIISNNGADQEITDFILETKKKDKRVKVLTYENNIFSFDDPLEYIDVLPNNALKIAEGEYIFRQSYDDLLALDYIERMVKLFEENPECITAAGLQVSIDEKSSVKQEYKEISERSSNYRSRYMPGHEMVLDYINPKGGKLFTAPGTIFSFRKDALVAYGGFHRSPELGQLYGIVPFGVTGFDEEAIFYWRRHEGQINKLLYQRGWCGVKEFESMLNDLNVMERWSNSFGEDVARYAFSGMIVTIYESAAKCTAICFFTFNFKGALRSLSDSFWRLAYWKHLPKAIWRHKMVLILSFLSRFQFLIQPFINLLNSFLPSNVPGSGVINKIKRYYDKGGVPTTIIQNKKSPNR